MATRPIFIPNSQKLHVEQRDIEFEWNPGFAKIQKQKNVSALHASAAKHNFKKILEVSTKSSTLLGKSLSAFNLKIEFQSRRIPFESAYQASKVFENDLQFEDLYNVGALEAKQDSRIYENNKSLTSFRFDEKEWGLDENFYSYLYFQALDDLIKNHDDPIKEHLLQFDAFTDIEFNPKKSHSCQAFACALFVSFFKSTQEKSIPKTREEFLNKIPIEGKNKQLRIFEL